MPRMLPVLLGGDANVYGMARSFYECYGVRSLAICRRALPALAHSRLVRVAVQDPAFGQDHVFTATLLGLAAQYPGVPKILISCADDYTALLARHADALRGAYRFACPPPAALHLADKRQFAAACRAAGLRTPQTVTLCPADALPPLPFGWPVIAKPADQAAYARCDFPGRRKVYLVQDAARLRELLAAAARGGYFGSWLVQEYIPGPDTRLGVVNAYCAADGSVPWLVQGQPLLQERTPEGIGNYAAVLVEPVRQDTALLDTLQKHSIDVVVLAGFLSVLGEKVIAAYRNKIINVHPSLIPSFCGPGFYGLRVHEAALARGVKLTGATVHLVNEECDGGPILLQKAVAVEPGDTPETLQKRVMVEAEWQLLPKALAMVCSDEV